MYLCNELSTCASVADLFTVGYTVVVMGRISEFRFDEATLFIVAGQFAIFVERNVFRFGCVPEKEFLLRARHAVDNRLPPDVVVNFEFGGTFIKEPDKIIFRIAEDVFTNVHVEDERFQSV